MNDSSEYTQVVSMKVNREQINTIRQYHGVFGQTDDQIASGVIVSYIERCLAKPHLSFLSSVYIDSVNRRDDTRVNITLTEGQWRKIEKLGIEKRKSRSKLLRWIIADTAVAAGYPRG